MKKYQLAEDIIPKSKNDYLNNIFFLAENQISSPVVKDEDILQPLEQQREFFEQGLKANDLI
jgi:hypothetical protein